MRGKVYKSCGYKLIYCGFYNIDLSVFTDWSINFVRPNNFVTVSTYNYKVDSSIYKSG